MIFPDLVVPASGPINARLMIVGMAPARNEVAEKIPLVGPSGRIVNEALLTSKTIRTSVRVTNLCGFFIDDNDLYSVPIEIMLKERDRFFRELEETRPNCLLILGGDTLDLLTAEVIYSYIPKKGKKAGCAQLGTKNSKNGIQKWRGSIFTVTCPSGRIQKCVAAMHPASFIRGQWKWLPLFKYIDVPRAVIQSSFPEMKPTKRSAIIGPSFRQATDMLLEANQKEWISIDYEGRSHLTCLGIGWTPYESMSIPLSRVGNPSYWTPQEEVMIWKLWNSLLENAKVKKIAQNASFEWIKSWLYGIYPKPLGCDTMDLHHCLYPDWGGAMDEWTRRKRDIDNPGHGLALITSQYTDQPYYKDDGRHWEPSMGEDSFWRYNCLDVMVTFEAAMKMMEEVRAAGLWNVYQENYLDPFEKYLQMEWDGVAIDLVRRDEVRVATVAEIEYKIEALEALLEMEVIAKTAKRGDKPKDNVLNLSSNKQMRAWFTSEGYHIPIDRKTGQPTLNKDTLQAFAIKGDERVRLMLRIRQLQDFTNDTLDMRLDNQGRVHCHFKRSGTNGTRTSSSESILGTGRNLQNLDRQGPARSLFLPS